MDNKRTDRKRWPLRQTSPARDASREKKGFAGLDPAKMGLGDPGWLTAASSSTETGQNLPLPGEDGAAPHTSVVSPVSEPVLEVRTVPRTVLEGMKVVCICKGIKQSVFWKALDTGLQTPEEINCHTGSGSGSCQGRRCRPRIEEMLRAL